MPLRGEGGGGGGGRVWPSHDPDNDPPGSITQDPGRRAKEPAGTGRMMAEEEEEGEGEGIEEGDCVSVTHFLSNTFKCPIVFLSENSS